MLRSVSFFVLLIGSFNVVCGRELSQDLITDETLAEQWLLELDPMMEKENNDVMTTQWNYNVNLTEENNRLQMESSLRRSIFRKDAYLNASRFDWRNFKNPDLKRQFAKVTDIGHAVLQEDDFKQMEHLRDDMQLIYSTAEICEKRPSSEEDPSGCVPQNPDLTRIVATSRDWDELLWAWKGWRDVTGKRMKSSYAKLVELLNYATRKNGYRDNGDYWRSSSYEMENFSTACEELFQQVRPLYQQLHAYVRRKLMDSYSKNTNDFPSTRQIPAHILGNIWAQTWNNIIDLVIPFNNTPVIDITSILVDKGFNALRMFREADSFFISLGLHPMPQEFWNNSLIEKPKDGRKVVCHASAWDFYNKRDFRSSA